LEEAGSKAEASQPRSGGGEGAAAQEISGTLAIHILGKAYNL